MHKRSKIVRIIWHLVDVSGIIIGILLMNNPLFAGNTATFSATCYMPSYVTAVEEEKALDGSEIISQNITLQEEIEKTAIGEETNLIQQQEKITSPEDNSLEVINTVCAK